MAPGFKALKFGRRKSVTNTLDGVENNPAPAPSFRVFERPRDGSKPSDSATKINGAGSGPPNSLSSNKIEKYEDNLFDGLNTHSNRYVKADTRLHRMGMDTNPIQVAVVDLIRTLHRQGATMILRLHQHD
jgi:hypothetical protein